MPGTPLLDDQLLPPPWTTRRTTSSDGTSSFRSLVGCMIDTRPVLHRAGLLYPRTYNLTPTSFSPPHHDTPDAIRAATVQLSNMPMPPLTDPSGNHHPTSLIPENRLKSKAKANNTQPRRPYPAAHHHPHDHEASHLLPEPDGEAPTEFIFPQPEILQQQKTTDADEKTPRMYPKPSLPQSSSSFSSSVSLPKTSSLSSSSSSSSGRFLGDSVGTLLSLTSMFTVPSSSAEHSEVESARKERTTTPPRRKAHHRQKQKQQQKQLSGLSLSRPPSLDGEGSPSSSSSSSTSTSRSASVDPTCRDERARLVVENVDQTSSRPPPPPSPPLTLSVPVELSRHHHHHLPKLTTTTAATAVHSRSRVPSSSLGGDETPRASVFVRSLPLPLPLPVLSPSPNAAASGLGLGLGGAFGVDIEKGVELESESSQQQQQGRASCSYGAAQQQHGQGHVRWRSPLRVAGRELERYVDVDVVESVGGTWSRDGEGEDEERPLIGGDEEEEGGEYVGYGGCVNADGPPGSGSGDEPVVGKKPQKKKVSKTFLPLVLPKLLHQVSTSMSTSTSTRKRRGGGDFKLKARIKKEIQQAPEYAIVAFKAVPAVMLGCLLNILDGVSYGMIIFPATGVFANLSMGPMGVSMFFVSTIVAQLVYTCGGSGFAGANGSMMIEVVPFFHIMALNIAEKIGNSGGDDPVAVVATTLVAYAFSSILTGLSFLLLGALKLGTVVGFFPRHILVGCIGGVGAFLIETGLTISLRMSEDEFSYSLATLKYMFEGHNFVLWILPLFLAILLRLITQKFHHQLVFPLYFLTIPAIFYVAVSAAKLDLSELRASGWLFDMGSAAHEPWYRFYTYFDFGKVKYDALFSTLPTQFALLFFNILHPPLNVPALAVSLDDDVDTNKELVAHGYSNFFSGLFGTVPNYLVYVNTLLFYRVGGGSRIAGFLLAIATVALLFIGPWPIAYIPVMVVGALIFVLGIDLVKEALWDNRHRASRSEYITIISIMITMTVWDFVIGVLFGIIVCCFFFVVQNSQLRSIRAIYTGDHAMSAVRRPSLQREYIREVSRQTTILRLQGFLFFGTITRVEESIRSLIEGPHWQLRPVQFLVLDLTLVAGIDMSSAEAFVRIHRLLMSRFVTLVFCGFETESSIGKSLSSVDVLGAPGVVLFANFNDAVEWTENAYLRAWFKSQKIETSPVFLAVPGRQDADIEYNLPRDSFVRSPRRSQIRDAGERTIAAEVFPTQQTDVSSTEPYQTLRKAFSSYGTLDPVLFRPISNYLEHMTVPEGTILWRQGEPPNGLYVIESGVLRASYAFGDPAQQQFDESMVAGTLAGELSALAESPRNATVMVEHGPAVMWKLSGGNLKRLQVEEPELARVFIQLVLKAAKLDYDILLAAIASRQ